MASAFQRTAFQNNAFQIDGGQLGGGGVSGGRIVGGTFSRGQWHTLREEQERKRRDAHLAELQQAKRKRELREAETAKRKAELRARWVQEDALAGAQAHDRLLNDALAAWSGVNRLPDHSATLAHAAQAKRDQDDDEAIALLLLSH